MRIKSLGSLGKLRNAKGGNERRWVGGLSGVGFGRWFIVVGGGSLER